MAPNGVLSGKREALHSAQRYANPAGIESVPATGHGIHGIRVIHGDEPAIVFYFQTLAVGMSFAFCSDVIAPTGGPR